MLKISGDGRVSFEPKIKLTGNGWWQVKFILSNKRYKAKDGEQQYDDIAVTLLTKDEELANGIKKGDIVEIPAMDFRNDKYEKDGVKMSYANVLVFEATIKDKREPVDKPRDDMDGINLDDLNL